jgi:hypothetical protein
MDAVHRTTYGFTRMTGHYGGQGRGGGRGGHVDCGGPRSNAMDQATQVSQQNKAMDALGARVMAVPGRRAADLGTL